MNYYEHHLGDYLRDTAHLSMVEDAAYRRLLDAYYIRERPLPVDPRECSKLARASTKIERDAVSYVLREFFDLQDDGHHQSRADTEIAHFQMKSQKAKASANTRWANADRTPIAKPSHANAHAIGYANASPIASDGNALQSPVSSPQGKRALNGHAHAPEAAPKPKPSKRVPADFEPDLAFALAELPDVDVATEVAKFRDWEYKTPRIDWAACWRTWIRGAKERGKYARKPKFTEEWSRVT